jgi:ABC-2 type transport system ATP-binding protein
MKIEIMTAIELTGVTKRYGSVTALRGLDLSVGTGEVFGFLGPNGAGKSTTIEIMLDHARPTSGETRVLGMDPREESVAVRGRTGVLPEGFGPLGEMTGREHVAFAVEARGGEEDPETILDRVGVSHAADRPVTAYSKGMAQRLMLGMALAGRPDLLILDEPTTGLDPNGAREMREIIRTERDRGATVFFSSHILEQVEAVCDRVGILRSGEVVAVDTIDNLRASVDSGATLTIRVDRVTDEAIEAVRGVEGVSNVRAEGDSLTMQTDGSKTAVLDAVESTGVEVRDFSTEEASLEDLFAAYTTGDRPSTGTEVDA